MLKAIKLRFTTPVHFGRGREELDKTELVYHSDSLKAALYATGLPMIDAWKDAGWFHNNFRISSCFPFAKDDFFLPRPQLKRLITFGNRIDDKAAKKAKKIEYLEKSVFEDFMGKGDEEFYINPENISPDGRFVCKSNKTFTRIDQQGNASTYAFYTTAVQQRVSVSREGDDVDSRPFYIDRIYFEADCGMYFLAEFVNNEIESQVYKVMEMLGENGIGTDRTVGNGQFKFDAATDVVNFTMSPAGDGVRYLLLGLFIPSREEHLAIDFSESSWNLLKRGGYMAGSEHEDLIHLRKRSIYMFGEGSVLKSGTQLSGQFIDLKPTYNDDRMHPVWRDGQCLMLKF